MDCCAVQAVVSSDFGLRVSFGFRDSGFGFMRGLSSPGPRLKRNWLLHRLSQAAQVFGPGNGDTAQLLGNRREHLDVEQHEALLAQVVDQVEQSDLRGVADLVEHGFPRKETAHRHPVNSADELAALPALQAVGVALLVQLRVGLDKLGADPRAPAAGSRRGFSDPPRSQPSLRRFTARSA